MYCCSAASLAAFLCPQDFPFVLIIRGAQKEILERELITRLAPIHVENFEQLLGANGPICVHFTARNCSYPLRRNWFALLQEALFGKGL
jgi:hypothetical protein